MQFNKLHKNINSDFRFFADTNARRFLLKAREEKKRNKK
jgi:hypothetical protein